jgi:hypothetical protein
MGISRMRWLRNRALRKAASDGSRSKVERLLNEGANVDSRNREGKTALIRMTTHCVGPN